MSLPDFLLPLSPADEHAISEGCYFDLAAAERVRQFFARFLKHSKGRWGGEPFELLNWQWEHVIAPLFGWLRADGMRRFRRGAVFVPKKNGKSTLCAGISLYLLVADNEPGAEIYSAAVDRNQASIIYREIESMVAKSPALTRRLKCKPSIKRVIYEAQSAWYEAMSADAPAKDGVNASAVVVDEIHRHKKRDMFDVLEYAISSRDQPLMLTISTAGVRDLESIGWEVYDYARRIRDGIHFDSSFFARIYEADEKDDWTDPKVWAKANPSLGVTISEESFKADFEAAKGNPLKENNFKRLRLNIWTNQETRWIPLEAWDACTLPLRALDGRPCYGGLDLASTQDLNAFVLCFGLEDGSVALLPHFWVPEAAAKDRERKNRTRLDKWIAEGHIKQTSGAVADYEVIRADIVKLRERYDIRAIYADRWNATGLATQLIADGFKVEFFGQGFSSMSGPMKELGKLIVGGKLIHGGNPVLRWCFGNVAATMDAAENIKPDKAAATDKIDGIVAAIMGLAGVMANPVVEGVPLAWI